MKNLLLATALIPLSCVQAFAQNDFAIPVTAEIMPGWVKSDGTRVAALHLTLEPGWKTYWRAPGDAGIPPSFDWSASRNLDTVSISWPAPKVFDQNGMRSIGYENTLVIPLAITSRKSNKPVHVRMEMDLGICADICIPHRLDFDAVLDTQTTKPTPAIVAALAQRPYTESEAGVRAATCRVEPIEDGLRIETRVTMPSAGGEEVTVIEPGIDHVWVSEATTHREGNQVIAVSDMMHVDGGLIALDRSAVRITVLGQSHAVDILGCTPG